MSSARTSVSFLTSKCGSKPLTSFSVSSGVAILTSRWGRLWPKENAIASRYISGVKVMSTRMPLYLRF